MKVSLAEEEVPIVKESLQRELRFSEAKVNLLKEEIGGFEERYGMSSEEFMTKFERGELGDEQDYFEWWGLLTGIKKIEEKLRKIKFRLAQIGILTRFRKKQGLGTEQEREEGQNSKRKKRKSPDFIFFIIGGRVDKGGLAPYLEKVLIQHFLSLEKKEPVLRKKKIFIFMR